MHVPNQRPKNQRQNRFDVPAVILEGATCGVRLEAYAPYARCDCIHSYNLKNIPHGLCKDQKEL
jgi:hypothetical protein